MNRLRSRLVLAFLLATVIPLAVSLWIMAALLERSLSLATTREIEELSRAVERTGREFYQLSSELLRADAEAGRAKPVRYVLSRQAEWPAEIAQFWESKEPHRFELSSSSGNELLYLVRSDGVLRYRRSLGAVNMRDLSKLRGEAWLRVEYLRTRDLRRGFIYPLLLVVATVGAVSLLLILFFVHRISRPVQKLTSALGRLAAGDLSTRVESSSNDEIGAAMDAFNHMAEQLQQSRERLIMLTRLSSWQALGRKMAHEVKNSLTPIRLTVEEMAVRQGRGGASNDKAFFEQAAQIIVEEVNRLERRVRAFSDLAAEPPVNYAVLDVNAIVEERVGFLRSAHPDVIYNVRRAVGRPQAGGDEDLARGILTNLLENAAEAAGAGGVVLAITKRQGGKVILEVHDSGPGLSLHARETLFQPTISFKKTGMGLGLSIARKSALLSGGDIELISGELGGAAFRLTLPEVPAAAAADEPESEPAWAHRES